MTHALKDVMRFRSGRLLLGLAVTVLLLLWALRGVSAAGVMAVVQRAHWGWLAVGLFAMLASLSVRALRWGTLLSASRDPGPFRLRHAAVFIGFGANGVLPANLGELVRAGVLQRTAGVPFGLSLGSIMTERLLDLAMVVTLLGTAMAYRSFHFDLSAEAATGGFPIFWALGALVAAAGAMALAAWRPALVLRTAAFFTRKLGLGRFGGRIESALRSVIGGLAPLTSPRILASSVLETAVMWSLVGFAYWAWLAAFGIERFGWSAALMVAGTTALAIAIPAAPGYFGPFEAAIRFSLGLYALPPDTIIAYSLTVHILILLGIMGTGAIFALRLGLHTSSLSAQMEARPSAEDSPPAHPPPAQLPPERG